MQYSRTLLGMVMSMMLLVAGSAIPAQAEAQIASINPTTGQVSYSDGAQGPRTVYTNHAPSPMVAARRPYASQLAQFIQNYNKKLSWEQANVMADAITEFSHRYNIDFRIVAGVLAVESAYRSDAISSSGAIGLGQLKPATAKWLGVVNPYDPIDNIAGSTRYLSWLLSRYNGSLDHAISAYYQGQGTVDKQGITPVMTTYLMKVNNVLKPMHDYFR